MLLLMHRKRVFPDVEVVEISRPINWSTKPKSAKQKEDLILLERKQITDVEDAKEFHNQYGRYRGTYGFITELGEVICLEVIDVDVEDVERSDGNVKFSGKGKEILVGGGSSANSGTVDGVQSSKKNRLSASSNPIIIDDFGSDVLDEHMYMYYDDDLDNYALLQSHFDNMDIPTGVEAAIPWVPGPLKGQMMSTTTSTSGRDVSGAVKGQSTSFSSSTLVGQPTPFGSSSSSPGPALGEGKLVIGSSNEKWGTKEEGSSGAAASKLYNESFTRYGKRLDSLGATASNGWGSQSTANGSPFPKFPVGPPVSGWMNPLPNQTTPISAGIAHASGANYFRQSSHKSATTAGSPSIPLRLNSNLEKLKILVEAQKLSEASGALMNSIPQSFHQSATTAGSLSIPSGPVCNGDNINLGETLKKYRLFKKFDTVEDHSDHFYSKHASAGKVASKNWAKKIQDEWKILEKDLPDTIFVRVYESRMDLLRAVIMGADGTPYHDGLYFFDVFFPSNYPNVPPLVHYHSFGLRINPNLYNCGKVCLSLLNTWSGQGKEKWIPRSSTMLQVLVSIQGLILNAKPYFNEPGFAGSAGTASGEKSSLQYNENTFILNLKTMVFSMRRPPQHFEDFVLGHFFQRAQDILVACQTYMDGAQVGSLVRGGVQDVDEGDKSCSPTFKASLAAFIKTVIDTLKEIGVGDCDKFLHLAQRGTGVVAPVVPGYAAGYFFG
ncbi:putative ubiquitin-conjugating enzyme E2 26 [Capsicum chinense]|nr:putative ubiquitin-conjugating enzyme E2 26 [Capsicum chinense]